METTKFINVTSNADVADALGDARAELAEVKSRIDFLEGLLKAKEVSEVDGARYRVSISYDIEKRYVNWKEIAAKFSPSRQLIAAYTSRSYYDRVNVSALKKEV